jgi:hypothetical protein
VIEGARRQERRTKQQDWRGMSGAYEREEWAHHPSL